MIHYTLHIAAVHCFCFYNMPLFEVAWADIFRPYSLFIFVMLFPFLFFALSLAGFEPMTYCSAIPCYNLVCHLVAHYVIAMYIAGHSDAV